MIVKMDTIEAGGRTWQKMVPVLGTAKNIKKYHSFNSNIQYKCHCDDTKDLSIGYRRYHWRWRGSRCHRPMLIQPSL